MRTEQREKLHDEITHALNRACAENESNTPDFILAEYLMACLSAFASASVRREDWYGGDPGSRAVLEDFCQDCGWRPARLAPPCARTKGLP